MNEKQVGDVRKRKKRENYIHRITSISFQLPVLEMMGNVVSSNMHPCQHCNDSCLQKLSKTHLHLTSQKNRENFLRSASTKRFGKSVSNRLKSILKLVF